MLSPGPDDRQLGVAPLPPGRFPALARCMECLLAEAQRGELVAHRPDLSFVPGQSPFGCLGVQNQPLRPFRRRVKPLRLQRQRIQVRNQPANLGVPIGIVVGRALERLLLQLRRARLEAGLLRPERRPLLGLRLEPTELADRLRQSPFRVGPLPLEVTKLRGLGGELIDPGLVVVPVEQHLLDLPVQHSEHVVVFRAERTGAGRAGPLRPRLGNAVELLLQVAVLIPQGLPLGAGVLEVAVPGGTPLLVALV